MSGDEFRVNPDDNTFIGDGTVDDWSVDGMMFYQQDIPWLQVIRFTFHDIGDLAGQEDDDFIEVMVMGFKFLLLLVAQMEEAEIAVQPATFDIAVYVGVLLIVHKGLRLLLGFDVMVSNSHFSYKAASRFSIRQFCMQSVSATHTTILYAMLQAENVMFETKSAVYTVVEREIQHIDTGEEHLIVTRVIFGT